MSRSTFKILFYVKKGSERANGYLPLMCRLTVDGEIKQFSCKLDVPPKLWDVKTARATGKSVEAQKINAAVDRIRVDVNRRYQELMQSDGYVTAARLRDVYLGLGVKRETLLKLFEQHNEEFIKKVGHSRVQGTYNRYRTIYKHLCEFVPKVYRRDDIPLKELNLTFINNFEYFLRTEKKCRTNTVWGYMIGLKHIISTCTWLSSTIYPSFTSTYWLPIYCALHTATRHKKSDNTAILLISSLIYLYRYILFHWQTVTA